MTATDRGVGRPSSLPNLTDAAAQEAWLKVRLEAAPKHVRQHADDLLAWTAGTSQQDQIKRAITVLHLHAFLDEIFASRDQLAESKESRARLAALQRRTEAGRQALLRGLDHIENAIDRADLDERMGAPHSEWPDTLRAATSWAHDQHREAWED